MYDLLKTLNVTDKSAKLIITYFISTEKDDSSKYLKFKMFEFQTIIHITNLIDLVKNSKSTFNTDNKALNELTDFIIKNLSRFFIPYDFIAFYIYHDDHDYNAQDIEESYSETIDSYYMMHHDSKLELLDSKKQEKLQYNLQKIQRHILLAIHQKTYMSLQAKKAEKLLEETTESYKKINDSITNLQRNIYTNFVTILGVFTAIIVTIFGSFTAISEAIKNFRSSLDYLFLLTSGLFFIAILVYLLFSWIEKIKGAQESNRKVTHPLWMFGAALFIIITLKIAKLFSSSFFEPFKTIFSNL